MNPRTRAIATIVVTIVAFALVSFFARAHQETLRALASAHGFEGMFFFVALTAAFVIFIVPLDLVLLIPLGAAAWGAPMTALLSITGWTLGAAAAFGIARWLGIHALARLVPLHWLESLAERVPKRTLFWLVVLLRMAVPVDLLSYALGLFSGMPFGSYVLATALGVAPFGFVFAYGGTLSTPYQIIILIAAFSIAAIILRILHKRGVFKKEN